MNHSTLVATGLLLFGIACPACKQKSSSSDIGPRGDAAERASVSSAKPVVLPAQTSDATANSALTYTDAADVGRAVNCSADSQDVLRAWCPIAGIASAAFAFPKVATTFIGLSVAIKTGASVRSSMLGKVTASRLSLGVGKAMLTSVTPSNEAEKRALAAIVASIALALKGQTTQPFAVGNDLVQFLNAGLKALATSGYAVARSATIPAKFKAANPSEIALVHAPKGDCYVVVEHAEDGVWLNVYPVRTYVP